MEADIARYRACGYEEIHADSGIGSRVLIHWSLGRVVKFGQDPAYDAFVEIAQIHTLPCFPEIILHEERKADPLPGRPRYSVTELELLRQLSPEEQRDVLLWIKRAFEAKRNNEDLGDDPHSLEEGLDILVSAAEQLNLGLDLTKGSNIMARERGGVVEFVFTDPFN